MAKTVTMNNHDYSSCKSSFVFLLPYFKTNKFQSKTKVCLEQLEDAAAAAGCSCLESELAEKALDPTRSLTLSLRLECKHPRPPGSFNGGKQNPNCS